jgi:hypothetical protein
MGSIDNALQSYIRTDSNESDFIGEMRFLRSAAKVAGIWTPSNHEDVILRRTLDYYCFTRINSDFNDNIEGKTFIDIGDYPDRQLSAMLCLRGCNVKFMDLTYDYAMTAKVNHPNYSHVNANLTHRYGWEAMMKKNKFSKADIVLMHMPSEHNLLHLNDDDIRIWDKYSDFIRLLKSHVNEDTLLFVEGPSTYRGVYDVELQSFKNNYFRDMTDSEFNRFVCLQRQSLFSNDIKCADWNYYEFFARDIV